jgi:hypothetical protein
MEGAMISPVATLKLAHSIAFRGGVYPNSPEAA